MDLIFSLLLDLIFEGSISASKNKKVPKFIRYLLIFVILLFFILVFGGVLILGIDMLENNMILGISIIFLDLGFLVISIWKFIKEYTKKINSSIYILSF